MSLQATETPGLFSFLVGGKNINHPILSNKDLHGNALLKILAYDPT
jgi:hypothetical protein